MILPQGINILASGQERLKNKELRLEVVFTLCGLRTNLEDVNIYEHVCVNVSERYPGQGGKWETSTLLNPSLISQER